ncbi:hypothetical protein [Methylophaga thalassica]|jgi:hypothetical protein|uniref:hypothetical protein n=1 Tax=Methylophaga thalassica TaxID=40223 RepID=UPI002E7AD9DF|nr:hypothetical protein [Methylophaga thalassica]WVI83892.1 hypothetical protein VSX76_00650 [Methylophaga thalassica]
MTDKSKSHDVFDGEIPKDLGKKKNPPLWVKLIFLVILVSVLGTAAYLLESDKEYEIEPGRDLTETVVSELISEDSNISKESKTNIIVEDNEGEQSSDLDILELENTDNEIQVFPPDANLKSSNKPGSFDEINKLTGQLDDLSAKIATVEDKESERIALIKSGMELHTQSVNKLNTLVDSLKDLKKELSDLKRVSTKSNTSLRTPQPVGEKLQTKNDKPTKLNPSSKTEQLKLLGIDSWGGVSFAQIEYNHDIHLLTTSEKIGIWEIISIGEDIVVIKNEKGVSFELNI